MRARKRDGTALASLLTRPGHGRCRVRPTQTVEVYDRARRWVTDDLRLHGLVLMAVVMARAPSK